MADPLVRYTLNGVDKVYDVGFSITSAKGTRAFINTTEIFAPLDFTISGSSDDLHQGKGRINLVSAYQQNDILISIRDTEEKRVTNFAKAARFEEKEIDAEFDNQLRLIEDALLYLTATPHFDPSQIGLINGQLPPGLPGAVIKLNDLGNGFDFVKIEDFPEFAAAVAAAKAEADRAQGEADRAGTQADISTTKAQESTASAELSRQWAEGTTASGNPPSDANNSKFWASEAARILIDKVDLILGNTGAMRVPVGTEAQKPTDRDKALMRFTIGEGFQGFDPIEKVWGGIGGGGVPKSLVKTADYQLAKGETALAHITNNPIKLTLPVLKPGEWSAVGDYIGTASLVNPVVIHSTQKIHGSDNDYYITSKNTVLYFGYIDDAIGHKIMYGIGEGGNDAPDSSVDILPLRDDGHALGVRTLPKRNGVQLTWADFESIDVGFDKSSGWTQTTTIPKEALQSWQTVKGIVRQNTGTAAAKYDVYGLIQGLSDTTYNISLMNTESSGGIKFMKGRLKYKPVFNSPMDDYFNRAWIDKTSQRNNADEYVNSNSYPIEVMVTVAGKTGGGRVGLAAVIEGVAIAQASGPGVIVNDANYISTTFTVPPGNKYKVTSFGGTNLFKWAELV